MNVRRQLEERLAGALASVTGRADSPAMVTPSGRPEFGDYQANGIMPAAKALKTNPRKLAEQVVAAAELSDLAERVEVAGPGFVNITLKPQWLAAQLAGLLDDDRLGVAALAGHQRQTVVIDYSHPNLAKEMHVGHLRSTIIGDALARTLEFLGHNVLRQNHVGDWGTQFGVVILGLWHICMAKRRAKNGDSYYIREDLRRLENAVARGVVPEDVVRAIRDRHEDDWAEDQCKTRGDGDRWFGPFLESWIDQTISIGLDELQEAYRYVNLVMDFAKQIGVDIGTRTVHEDETIEYHRIAYSALPSKIASMVQNQAAEANGQERGAWKRAVEISLDACQELYDRLGVSLGPEDVRGESAYNDDLPGVVAELRRKLRPKGMFPKSDDAQCVFLEEFTGKDGKPLPVIVRKSDGGYLYATTDLAAVRYRVNQLKADRILYVVDARQTLHLRQVFAVARAAGFAPARVSLEHAAFGMMLGADGRPFRTREGGTVKLMDLLDQAESRAKAVVLEKNPDLQGAAGADEIARIARTVGIGAVKYADLAQNRGSDYVFSFERMLSLDGNTAPYMQYAYARIRSIFRKSALGEPDRSGAAIGLDTPPERALGLKLLQLPETLQAVAGECLPNVLCAYLYDLAAAFTGFYENCPVLQSPEPVRTSRLALCDLTARAISRGLGLLGIDTVEQM